MQLRLTCSHCHRPFAMKPIEVEAALEQIHAEGLNYLNVHCPHCGHGNRVSRTQLKRAAPGWKPGAVSAEDRAA